MSTPQAVAVVLLLLVLAYLAMWRGWRARARKHDLPPLPQPPALSGREQPASLAAEADYVGTTVAGDWLDRVVARGLGLRGPCSVRLSEQGLDVHRAAGSFRVPRGALRGARHDQGLAGKVVPPHGLLVVTWAHGDRTLDTGLRLSTPAGDVTAAHNAWVGQIATLAGSRPAPFEGDKP